MIAIMSGILIDMLGQMPRSERTYEAGAFLFHREDPVRVIHRVVDGTVHLVRHQEDGGATILQRAGPGAILAEASLFSEDYHCDAIAVDPTTTQVFDKRRLAAELKRNADLAEGWAAHLAGELQAARLRAELLSLKTVAARLDAWLIANGGMLPSRGAWKTIAAEIGTSPEAFYRELARRRAGGRGVI